MKKFFKGNNDSVFKTIFTVDKNRHLLERLIEDILNIKVNIISLKVPELPKNKINNKGKILDVLVEANDVLINIEVNNYSDETFHKRNMAYICKNYSDYVDVGETYNDMPEIIQINLSSEYYEEMPDKSIYKIYDKEHNKTFVDNFTIIEINLTKAKELCYNGIDKSLVGMLDCNLEELNQIKGDKEMEEFKKQVKLLNEDEEFSKLLSDEDEERLTINTLLDCELKKGIEQGIEQGKIETAKNMLNKNLDINLISEITGLSTENIEKLK